MPKFVRFLDINASRNIGLNFLVMSLFDFAIRIMPVYPNESGNVTSSLYFQKVCVRLLFLPQMCKE